MENLQKKSQGASTNAEKYGKLASEIERTIDMQNDNASIDTEEKVNAQPETEADEGAAEFSIGDAEIERAVRAGLSVSDARAFTSKDAFEHVLATLEKRGNDLKDGKGEKSVVEDSDDFDFPELTEDEEFDPKLVKLSSTVKKMGKLLKELNTMRKAGVSAAQGTSDSPDEGAKTPQAGRMKIARPGGVPSARREKTENDVLAEVAGVISSKFKL